MATFIRRNGTGCVYACLRSDSTESEIKSVFWFTLCPTFPVGTLAGRRGPESGKDRLDLKNGV